jgi:serine-type D-Ala-D-Ala carboxypeptidase (penicillin-binding protein 5/6)
MKKDKYLFLKISFIVIFFILFLWIGLKYGTKGLENLLSSSVEKYTPSIRTEIVKTPLEELGLIVNSKSSLSVKIDKNGKREIIFSKFPGRNLPIASLSKLMTAVIALENYPSEQRTLISSKSLGQECTAGDFFLNQDVSLDDLLKGMLVESSNDAAWALAEVMGTKKFVRKMNQKASDLELNETFFVNPSGLDPDDLSEPINVSTSRDLLKLVEYIIKEHPTIFKITRDNTPKNTNILISQIPEIYGGKTGFTDEAGGCILLVLKKNENYYINIVIGATSRESRFDEILKLSRAVFEFEQR